jgi:protocatechuate 3,4-dioxygenase beta subunit
VTEGPYWVENALPRRNITERKPGLPLVIRFTVLNAKTCKPIENADVEIWHCDALGNYSAVNGATSRFLRGHLRSNATGKAEFLTIFPGWYRGRTPHIHMKVSVGGNTVHTGQIFFNEKITAAVYRQAPYASRGQYDTAHSRDSIYRQAGGASAELKLTKRTGGLRGYVGTIAIGVVT